MNELAELIADAPRRPVFTSDNTCSARPEPIHPEVRSLFMLELAARKFKREHPNARIADFYDHIVGAFG